MATTIEDIRIRVRRRIRADLAEASLTAADLHENSIDGWANECTHKVMDIFLPKNPGDISTAHCDHFRSLIVQASSLTFASGNVAFPSGFYRALAVTASTSYSDLNGDTVANTARKAQMMFDLDKFRLLDSANFVLTPTQRNPVVLISDKVYVKPTAITSGTIDYVKVHPTITTSQDTLFDELGDSLLVSFIMEKYYDFIEEPGMSEKVRIERKEMLSGAVAV